VVFELALIGNKRIHALFFFFLVFAEVGEGFVLICDW